MAVNPASTPANMASNAQYNSNISNNHDINSTIRITKRHDRSTLMMLLQVILNPIGHKIASSSEVHPAGSPQLTPHKRATKRCDVNERKVEDIYLYDIIPKNETSGVTQNRTINDEKTSKRKRRVFYYSGGGWSAPAN